VDCCYHWLGTLREKEGGERGGREERREGKERKGGREEKKRIERRDKEHRRLPTAASILNLVLTFSSAVKESCIGFTIFLIASAFRATSVSSPMNVEENSSAKSTRSSPGRRDMGPCTLGDQLAG